MKHGAGSSPCAIDEASGIVVARAPPADRRNRDTRHNLGIASGRLIRLVALVLAAAVVAGGMAEIAPGALFVLFRPTAAQPGEVVTVRTGGTPATFTLRHRKKPFRQPIRLYLVPNTVADEVHNRFDKRLHFVGQLAPDRNGRGILNFTVPPLDTDDYAAAAWCPGCARYSFGGTFFVLRVGEDIVPRYRPLMLLQVEMPSATETCPVTIPNSTTRPPGLGAPPAFPGFGRSPRWHTNGFLWTALPLDGVYHPPGPQWVEPDGAFSAKLYWFAAGVGGALALKGERIDAVSPALVIDRVNRGQWSGLRRGSVWATPVTFPSEGCWKLTVQVKDVSLSFVLKVASTS